MISRGYGLLGVNPSVTPDLCCLPLAPSSFYDLESLFIHNRRQIFLWNKASGVVVYKEPLFGAALSWHVLWLLKDNVLVHFLL